MKEANRNRDQKKVWKNENKHEVVRAAAKKVMCRNRPELQRQLAAALH